MNELTLKQIAHSFYPVIGASLKYEYKVVFPKYFSTTAPSPPSSQDKTAKPSNKAIKINESLLFIE